MSPASDRYEPITMAAEPVETVAPAKAIVTVFENPPDGGLGLHRDMRVRWALEEVGKPYELRLLSFAEMRRPAHRALHPFGQLPTYEEGDLKLFESGAIVFHIADRHEGLLPVEPNARARAVTWMFAALTTIEPTINERIESHVRYRLNELSNRLGTGEWLEGSFTAGDLLMVTVLRTLQGTSVLREQENLVAYVARAEARPAFKRALVSSRPANRSTTVASRSP